MHGACIIAMACNSLMEQVADGGIERLEGISVRFANPVFPGEVLSLKGHETKKSMETGFNVYNSHGKTVLKKGSLTVR